MTDQPAEQAPTVEELQESIDELSAYRERLYNDVLGLGKKLRLSQKKIFSKRKKPNHFQKMNIF